MRMSLEGAHEHELADNEHAPGVNEPPRSTYLEVTIYRAAVYSFTRAKR
jgi:hypothetical protein